MTNDSPDDIERALYYDDDGLLVGLDEIQLMENPATERVQTLKFALSLPDLELQYRAAMVLAAWGDDAGLDAIESLIDARIDRLGVEVEHRIYGYNNIYDEFAYAMKLYAISCRRLPDQCRIYRKLLALYGEFCFEGRLKQSLLSVDSSELLPDVIDASHRAWERGRFYLASQLLPVIASWSPPLAWELLPRFLTDAIVTPNPTANVVEALSYIRTLEGTQLLLRLAEHPDEVVSNEARALIDRRMR